MKKEPTPKQTEVYEALLSQSEQNKGYVNLAGIARDFGVYRTTIKDHAELLQKKGYIKIIRTALNNQTLIKVKFLKEID